MIAVAVLGLHQYQVSAAAASVPSVDSGGTGPAPASSAAGGATRYRDGTYAAQGHYLTPGGNEAIGVRLTVVDGRIVRSSVEVQATSPTARQFQQQFASRYATRVVSRDLSSLRVSRVAGASLTSLGFDNALATIRKAASVDA